MLFRSRAITLRFRRSPDLAPPSVSIPRSKRLTRTHPKGRSLRIVIPTFGRNLLSPITRDRGPRTAPVLRGLGGVSAIAAIGPLCGPPSLFIPRSKALSESIPIWRGFARVLWSAAPWSPAPGLPDGCGCTPACALLCKVFPKAKSQQPRHHFVEFSKK